MPQRLRAKGQALVEFALMATLIFFLLAATVDLGLIFFTLQGLHNAAQEGATYGSRWLATNSTTGASELDYTGIRNRARFEAGNRGSGFANLLDLDNNRVDDMTEDGAHIGAATGTTLFPTYIQIRALVDVDGDGNPLNDNTDCPSVSNKQISCFLQVRVSSKYKMLFPFAPSFLSERLLTSSYVIPMRSGMSQGGAPVNTPVIVTVTQTPTGTPLPTPTLAPTPTGCPLPDAPSLTGSQTGQNVNLSWGAITGATSYSVQRSTQGSLGPFLQIASTSGTSASDSIPAHTTYWYIVKATNDCGQGPSSGPVEVIRP